MENIKFHYKNQSELDLLINFVGYLRQAKAEYSGGTMVVEPMWRKRIVDDSVWGELLDVRTRARLRANDTWDIEDILDCVLSAEYELINVKSVDSGTAILEYDPLAFPFGGTDPLKALIEAFGFAVTGDSLNDGLAKWLKNISG